LYKINCDSQKRNIFKTEVGIDYLRAVKNLAQHHQQIFDKCRNFVCWLRIHYERQIYQLILKCLPVWWLK